VPETPPKLKEKLPTWIAAAAATMTTTLGLSYFGVAGTLIGVGLGSIITGVGATLYERWIRDAHARAAAARKRLAERRVHQSAAQADREFDKMLDQSYYRPTKALRRFDIPWKRVLIISGSSLAICLVVVAAIELIAHKPLAAVVTGHKGNGTSFSGGTVQQNNPQPSPSYVQPTPTVVPSSPMPVPTMTVATASPSVTANPASAGPSESATPSPSPSPSPTQEEPSVPVVP
jgi:hypothetical protein